MNGLGRHRLGVQIALGQFAAEILEHVRLTLCFDTFRDNFQAKAVCEHDNNANDFPGFGIRIHSRDERTVDLQRVYWKVLQPAERGMTFSKAIDPKAKPERL